MNLNFQRYNCLNSFEKEISSISKEFFNHGQFQYKEFLSKIKLSISGYLIKQSYSNYEIFKASSNTNNLFFIRKYLSYRRT